MSTRKQTFLWLFFNYMYLTPPPPRKNKIRPIYWEPIKLRKSNQQTYCIHECQCAWVQFPILPCSLELSHFKKTVFLKSDWPQCREKNVLIVRLPLWQFKCIVTLADWPDIFIIFFKLPTTNIMKLNCWF